MAALRVDAQSTRLAKELFQSDDPLKYLPRTAALNCLIALDETFDILHRRCLLNYAKGHNQDDMVTFGFLEYQQQLRPIRLMPPDLRPMLVEPCLDCTQPEDWFMRPIFSVSELAGINRCLYDLLIQGDRWVTLPTAHHQANPSHFFVDLTLHHSDPEAPAPQPKKKKKKNKKKKKSEHV